ncbi:MAG TPA: alpha/beta hydrolase [Gemmatimonadaceae bacterium]
MRTLSRVLAGSLALLVGTGALLYVKGMHAARPITTVITRNNALSRSRRLLVFVKGGSADMDTYSPLLDRLRREPELANADVLLFDHQLARLTIGHEYDFATRLRAEIDEQWIRHGGYDDVILAGHSTGSLLVRAAYLQSAGVDPRQPRTIPWSDRVSRIVLLAGIGRGVDAEERGRWKWVLRVGRFIPFIRSSVMYDALRGSDFVTQIRIGWIRHFSELENTESTAAARSPLVVQLIGTEDDVLRRDDSIDLEQFPTAYHLDVPGAGHQTLHRLDLVADPEAAYGMFREAFVSDSLPHARATALRADADTVQHVVLLLHGMRSSRDEWVHEIAPLLRQRIPHAEIVESSYGWISLLGFALPSVRRREVRWLQDQYTEYLARHLRATFDVIAHSNGTYLVGQALEHVPSLRFRRIVLLGSVLPVDYSWEQRRAWGQAEVVRSDRVADDLVVALFCSALRGVGMSDVGTSGWRGFESSAGLEREVGWNQGGHSAALSSENLKSLADFLATGRLSATTVNGRAPSRSIAVLSQLAPWLAPVLLLLIIGVSVGWVWRAPQRSYRLTMVASAAAMTVILLDII